MLVELVFNQLDLLWDDFGLIVQLNFLNVLLVKYVELLLLGLERLEHFALDNMVALLFHLSDDHL
jgi:hypothetical protein